MDVITDYDKGLRHVNTNGMHLKNLSEELQRNKDIVYAAVCQNSDALLFADLNFREDFDIILAAVTNYNEEMNFENPYCIASPRLQKNPKIITEILVRSRPVRFYIMSHDADLYREIDAYENITRKLDANEAIKYFIDGIKNGSFRPLARLWMRRMYPSNFKIIYDWMCKYYHEYVNDCKNSFDALFKSQLSKFGYYDFICADVLSFFSIKPGKSEIMNDIFHNKESDWYAEYLAGMNYTWT